MERKTALGVVVVIMEELEIGRGWLCLCIETAGRLLPRTKGRSRGVCESWKLRCEVRYVG